MKIRLQTILPGLLLTAVCCQSLAQDSSELTVKQIMNNIITPMTTTIWGAYQLETDAQWQEVENAAISVIAAGIVLGDGAADFSASAGEQSWRDHNAAMIAAARQIIVAVGQKDEAALSAAGNDALYPPCESCHQQYQQQ
jgi:cytochrome c556